jgi:hypothetical protein
MAQLAHVFQRLAQTGPSRSCALHSQRLRGVSSFRKRSGAITIDERRSHRLLAVPGALRMSCAFAVLPLTAFTPAAAGPSHRGSGSPVRSSIAVASSILSSEAGASTRERSFGDCTCPRARQGHSRCAWGRSEATRYRRPA